LTTQELIDYYANLLTLQYIGKPNAYATIQALVTPALMPQADLDDPTLPLAVQSAFNVIGETATGVQLDVVGKYQGVERTGRGFTGAITLSDTDFLSLIQMASVVNNADSSLSTIQTLLNQFFPGGVIRVFDNTNMQLSYLISTDVGSQDLIQLFVTEGLLPKPMGVGLSTVIYAETITTFFGFRTYLLPALNVTPFNSYDDYETGRPWLSYSDAITA
jgi:hypothetical protein